MEAGEGRMRCAEEVGGDGEEELAYQGERFEAAGMVVEASEDGLPALIRHIFPPTPPHLLHDLSHPRIVNSLRSASRSRSTKQQLSEIQLNTIQLNRQIVSAKCSNTHNIAFFQNESDIACQLPNAHTNITLSIKYMYKR